MPLPTGRSAAALLATVSLALGAQACGEDDEPAADVTATTETQTTEPAGTGAEQPAGDRPADKQLEALLAAPQRFRGQRVTVTGEIDGAARAPGAFRLDRPRDDLGIIVLATEEATGLSTLTAGDTVTVEGEVLEVTPDLEDKKDFLFETASGGTRVRDEIDTPFVVAADRVTAGG